MSDIRARHCPVCNRPVEWNEPFTTYPVSMSQARNLIYVAVHDACYRAATDPSIFVSP